MIVMKFGGTSVGDAERIRNVANIIKSNLKKKPVVVVSAVTKVTDMLLGLAGECFDGNGDGALSQIKNIHCGILEELGIGADLLDGDFGGLFDLCGKKNFSSQSGLDRLKLLDHFQSFGERMSSKIVAAELEKIGVKARAFDSWDIGFITNSEFSNAEPLDTAYANVKNSLGNLDFVPVITGFIAKAQDGSITTLGRGGSDYTASVIGSAIGAEEIQIWTDVDGIMSADPKIVGNAKTIRQVSFAEASELSYFGAKVLHPKTILPAMRKSIPVKVLNSFNPKGSGTLILSKPMSEKAQKNKNAVRAIAHKNGITLINIESTRMLGAYGFLATIFNIFSKHKKSIDVVSTSEVSVSLTLENGGKIDGIMEDLKAVADTKVYAGKSIICIVGDGMRNSADIPCRAFATLSKCNIHIEMVSMGASEINMTFIVDGKDAKKAVIALHKEYFG